MAEQKFINRVGSKLSSLLMDEDLASARPANCGGRASSGLHVSSDDIERHVNTLLGGDNLNQPLAGRVNFVGLSKIRDKLGDRWDRVANRADEIASKAIERRLTAADVYTRYQELNYLIIFAQLSKEQAQLKCALIAEEITKHLLGEDVGAELLDVKTMLSALDGYAVFEDVPSVETLALRLAGDEAAAAQGAAARGAPPSPDENDAWWETDPGVDSDPLAAVQLVYRPMWDVKHNAVTTYLCVPAVSGPAGRLLVGESELSSLDDAAVIQRLDFMVQRRVVTDLRKLLAAQQRMLLCLPVHFETLASHARRTKYIELCQRGIPPHGTKQLAFELTGVPPGVPLSRLLDLSSVLRRFGRGILLRTTVDQLHFRTPNESGIAGVGFENKHPASESRRIQEMEQFAAAAKKVGLVAYVHGLESISLTTAAIAAGFDFVDGRVVKSVVDHPETAYSFDVSDLFAGPCGR
jgi:hypothetical protein